MFRVCRSCYNYVLEYAAMIPDAARRVLPILLAVVGTACNGAEPTDDAASGNDPINGPIEARLTVPTGMKATVFATDLPGARFMVLGPDGAVYVSQPGANRITRLLADSSGKVTASVAVQDLNAPHGMAFYKDYLYIANTDGVVRVKLDANGKAIGTPEKLNSYSSGGGHWTRSIAFGADGAMYVSIGSSCNICVEGNADRAAVMRYDEHGKNGSLFSKGLRNAVGIAMHPVTKDIWVSTHERDYLQPDHEDLPPEEINILTAGADYGWPYCWGNKQPNPEFNNPARCGSTVPPAFSMQAHSAPLGITFLDKATQLPASQRTDLLVAFHGSWNRTVPTGAKVVRIRLQNNAPVAIEDFVTGWQRADGSRWGRPVDVLVYKDGSLLVSDDMGGVITRISKE